MTEPSELILVEREGPVTTVVLNRPQVRNALDIAASEALAAAFFDFERDANARVAVLWGRGGSFCSGADLSELAEGRLYRPWATSLEGPTRPALTKPVLAAVEGHACAGGLGLALWCDLRIADTTAIFGVFSRRWGVPMSDGTTVRLPRVIGQGRALDMLLTGRPVAAREALEIGLVNRVVGAGRARSEAEKIALGIADFPQEAMLCDRRSAIRQFDLPLERALREESEAALKARQAAVSGARRFADGEGRHGEGANN